MTTDKLTADEWAEVQNELQETLDDFRTAYEGTTNNNETMKETEDYVIFGDGTGHELTEIAKIVGVDRAALSRRMHNEARKRYTGDGVGDPWGYLDPVVVIKKNE